MAQRVARRISGQSTLEYILVIAAVLIALVAVTLQVLRPAVQTMSQESANVISGAANRIAGPRGLNLP